MTYESPITLITTQTDNYIKEKTDEDEDRYKFCPYCGADMRGGDDNEERN